MRRLNTVALGMCAVVITTMAGCDESVGGDGASSESTVCSTVGTTAWFNQSFADQTGRFHVDFSATPSASNVDAVVGLSNGAATKWASLAAIVRFNPDGGIDARSGSTYTAVQPLRYDAGATYFIRIAVDVRSHTYSAWASTGQGSYGSYNQVARDYPFRTEQAAVTKLNNFSSFVNPDTGPGRLQVCGFAMNTDSTAGNGCIAANAGGGFSNYAVGAGINTMIVDVGGTASVANMDGVIGVASGAVDSYDDFAASVRFWTNGEIEARDGDTYRSFIHVPYAAGVGYAFKFVIDISNKTYSVYVNDPATDNPPVELARNFRFRPQQLAVTRLDRVATVVASSSGHVDACGAQNSADSQLVYAYRGAFRIESAANDGALISNGTATMKLDANGKVVATLPVGGAITTDTAGNMYVASVSSVSTITVYSYTSAGALRWSRSIASDGFPLAAAVTTTGRLLFTTGPGGNARVYYVSTDGTSSGLVHFGLPGAVAPGPTGYVITANVSGGVQFSSYDPYGNVRWTKIFGGSFSVQALDVGPDGSVVFGGEFYDPEINFGDQTLYRSDGGDGPRNAYVVALNAAGALRFSKHEPAGNINGLDTNGNRIAVALDDVTQFPWISMDIYDTAGNPVRTWNEEGFGLGDNGGAYSIALTPSGRVIARLNVYPFWRNYAPNGNGTSYEYVVGLAP